jgi:ferredoxin
LIINKQSVDVSLGCTILDAAQKLGITIPTLCYLQGKPGFTSCMICVVKNETTGRLVPSCSAPAIEGMVINTDSDEVRQERKKILDLLLSEHAGDCEAPCTTTCPARMDIPLMIRQIEAGQMKEAYETVTERIALPAVLGRICPAPCENACRRGHHDAPVSICLLKRFVADSALKVDADVATLRSQRSLPSLRSTSPAASGSRKVAIIGAGPAGLAAAFYLARAGHACTVFDEHEEPGGQLRYRVARDKLPLDVLDREIDVIRKLGVIFQMNTRIEPGEGIQRLKADYDAIVLTPGRTHGDSWHLWPVESDGRGVKFEAGTFRTSDPVVFAGGEVVHVGQMSVRAVAHGKSIACAIDQWLGGRPVVGLEKSLESRLGRLREGEIDEMMKDADPLARVEPEGEHGAGYSTDKAVQESRRCLQCDCRKARHCKLRDYSAEYGASQKTFTGGARTKFTRLVSDTPHLNPLPQGERKDENHRLPLPSGERVGVRVSSASQVILESGKCIKCGICVHLSGLAFLGRGYETVVGVPFGDSLESALGSTAAECVSKCPTGALVWKKPFNGPLS